jgi:hypothetical protein
MMMAPATNGDGTCGLAGRQAGSALLLAVGATAALGTLALALLSASLAAYEIAALQGSGAQARLLAESALDRVGEEVARGRLGLPGAGETTVWEAAPPPPPPGVSGPSGASAGPSGCGFRARLSLVPGPFGPQRLAADGIEATLFDVLAEGWCGRGYHRREARYARRDDGGVLRLY